MRRSARPARRCTRSPSAGATARSRARARVARASASRPAKRGIRELALRVVLQGLRRRDGRRRAGSDARAAGVTSAASRDSAARASDDATRCPFMHGRLGPAGHGDVHRGRRLRRRRVRRAGPARPPGLRPQRRGDAQLRRRRARHPQLDLRASAAPTSTNILDFEDDYPGRPRGQARAELPLDADDPVGRQRGRRQQPRAHDEGAVDRHRRGRPDPGARAGRRARRGAVRGGGDRADGRRGGQPRRDRGLLPDQRAVAGARGHAGAGADRLPGHRRHEVLRAGGDPGRDRVPDVPGQPAGRERVHADRELAAARARADVAVARAQPRRHDGGRRCGRRPRSRARVPGLGTAAQKALGRFMSTMERLRERVEGGAPVGERARARCCARPATSTRWRPSGRSRRRAGSRTSRSSCGSPASTTRPPRRAARSASSCSRSRCSPTPTRARTTRAS